MTDDHCVALIAAILLAGDNAAGEAHLAKPVGRLDDLPEYNWLTQSAAIEAARELLSDARGQAAQSGVQ